MQLRQLTTIIATLLLHGRLFGPMAVTSAHAEGKQVHKEKPCHIAGQDAATVEYSKAVANDAKAAEVEKRRDNLEAVRSVRKELARIDRIVRGKSVAKRVYVLNPAYAYDDSMRQAAAWTESTHATGAASVPHVIATAYVAAGKTVFVEFRGVDVKKPRTNLLQYYFYDNGAIANYRLILRTFRDTKQDSKVTVTLETFYDNNGDSVGDGEEYRHPQTGKKIARVLYSAGLPDGFPRYTISSVEDLPFFAALRKPRL